MVLLRFSVFSRVSFLLLFLLLFQSAGGAVTDIKDGLICHFPFDEIRDGKTPDRSNSALHAEIRGSKSSKDLLVDGVYGNAFKFDSAWEESSVILPEDNRLNLRDEFTITFWINPAQEPAAERRFSDVICKQHEDQSLPNIHSGYRIRFYNRRLDVIVGLGDERKRLLSERNAVPYETWSHVAITFDGRSLTVFVNGQTKGFLEWEEKRRLAINSYRVVVGAFIFPRHGRFTGLIDDLTFYDRLLSLEEITHVMVRN